MCIDCRKVKEVTVGHSYSLKLLDDITDDLGQAKHMLKLDLLQGALLGFPNDLRLHDTVQAVGMDRAPLWLPECSSDFSAAHSVCDQ